MLSEQEHIDDFFRQKQQELQIDKTNSTEHWQQMSALLKQNAALPPKKRFWKKITRRTITYMGVAAVVVTTSYYAYKTSGKKITAKKNVPAVITKTNSLNPAKEEAPQQQPSAKIKPVQNKIPSNNAITKYKEKSDTVFLPSAKSITALNMPTTGEALQNFYSGLKQPVQQFVIDPEKDTTLIGRQGTVLKIAANSFSYPDRKPVKQPVTITLTECYTYSDMLAHQLHSISNDKQLETGGMINIQASDKDHKTVKLFGYRPIRVSMPTEKFDPGMQLFLNDDSRQLSVVAPDLLPDAAGLSNETVINWRPSGQAQGYSNTNQRFVHPDKIKLFDVRQTVQGMNQKDEAVFLVKTEKNIPDDKIKRLISDKYYTDITKTKLKRVADFSSETKGKNTNVLITKEGFVASDSIMISYNRAIREGFLTGKDSLAYVMQLRADSVQYVEERRADSIRFVRLKEFDSKYNFDITGLGWINCDKFYKADQPKIEFSINLDTSLNQAMSNYTLVFTNIKSLIKGRYENGQINFGKLPEDEPVHLVCIAAINNKAVACVQSFKISAQAVTSLKFEEITATEFRRKIEKL